MQRNPVKLGDQNHNRAQQSTTLRNIPDVKELDSAGAQQNRFVSRLLCDPITFIPTRRIDAFNNATEIYRLDKETSAEK